MRSSFRKQPRSVWAKAIQKRVSNCSYLWPAQEQSRSSHEGVAPAWKRRGLAVFCSFYSGVWHSLPFKSLAFAMAIYQTQKPDRWKPTVTLDTVLNQPNGRLRGLGRAPSGDGLAGCGCAPRLRGSAGGATGPRPPRQCLPSNGAAKKSGQLGRVPTSYGPGVLWLLCRWTSM